MKLDGNSEVPVNDTLLLGCNRGYLLKYERPAANDSAPWTKTGECRLEQSITEVLQIHPLTVLCVQDEGIFDVVDVTSMQTSSHTPSLPGITKSYKTQMTQRSAGLAIADANGFFFATMVSDNAGHTNVRMTDEVYAKNSAVNDFVEFKRDNFLITILEANHFLIVQRPKGEGFFDSGKTTKIRSLHSPYLSMGI